MLVRIRWSSCEFVRMYQGKTWSQNNDWNCGLPWGKFLILILILDKLEVGQEHMHRNNVLLVAVQPYQRVYFLDPVRWGLV